MKHKIIAGILAFSLLLISPLATFASSFTDIEGHWAEAELIKAIELEIMNGYGNGKVGPNDRVTRAQFAAFLVRALELTKGPNEVNFSDVEGHVLSNEIYIAASHELITGYTDGTFGPGDDISRLAMAIMIDRALQLKGLPQKGGSLSFTDTDKINTTYRDAVANAVHYGVINGIADGKDKFKFSPEGKATRAQGAKVIIEMLNAEENTDSEVVDDAKDEGQVEEVDEKTYYNITLQSALDMQMKVNPQTDKYRNSPAYVAKNYVKLGTKGKTSPTSGSRMRTAPNLSADAEVIQTVASNSNLIILDTVEGEMSSGSIDWYYVNYRGKEGYIHSALVTDLGTQMAIIDATTLNVRSQPSESSHIYGKFGKGTEVEVLADLGAWIQVPYSTWRSATSADVQVYLDPTRYTNDEKQIFQFLDLSKTTGTSVESLDGYLSGKGILNGMGAAFIYAGRTHGVNEVYLISHAILETGHGTSALAKGIEVGLDSKGAKVMVTENNRSSLTDIKMVYNMFGIGAYDSCPEQCGSARAYELGWDTPQKAIIGGADFISRDYVQAGQNTLYKMRWNPDAMVEKGYASHQYATDIGWASKQVNSIYNLYKEIGIKNVYLNIPVYKK